MSASSALYIRKARAADAGLLSPLLSELGYPTEAAEVRRRLERLSQLPHVTVLVAESGGELVAVAAFQPIELLHGPQPQCRITGLVVRSDRRRQGIGRRLVEAIERAARDLGCFRLELTTRPDRPDALPFYSALGFTDRPHRLVKGLEDSVVHRSRLTGGTHDGS